MKEESFLRRVRVLRKSKVIKFRKSNVHICTDTYVVYIHISVKMCVCVCVFEGMCIYLWIEVTHFGSFFFCVWVSILFLYGMV